MPAKHRPNPRTQATRHRVYRIPEPLRKAIKQKRGKRGQTVQEFIQAAVTDELPRLVETLSGLGVEPAHAGSRPAKLPLDDQLLAALRKASGETGVSQSQLLTACLRSSVARKRRPAALHVGQQRHLQQPDLLSWQRAGRDPSRVIAYVFSTI